MSTPDYSAHPNIIPEVHVINETITPEIRPLIDEMWTRINTCEHFADPTIRNLYNDTVLMRFLRARALDINKATQLILEDIEWRATFKPHEIKLDDVEFQATTGKIRISPIRDQFNRPVVVLYGKFEAPEMKKHEEQQIKYLIWSLETACRLMEGNVGKYTVLINMDGFSLFNQPSSHVSRESAKALSSRFPERLGAAIILNAPFYFRAFYAMISAFVDARTKSKITFIKGDLKDGSSSAKEMEAVLGPQWREIGFFGPDVPQPDKTVAPGYVHEEYWAEARAREERWAAEAAGSTADAAAAAAADTADGGTAAASTADADNSSKLPPPSYDAVLAEDAAAAAADAKAAAVGEESPEADGETGAVAVASPGSQGASAASP